MGDQSDIVSALRSQMPESEFSELLEAASRLVGFFECLLKIEAEQKEKSNEDQRNQHPVHKAK